MALPILATRNLQDIGLLPSGVCPPDIILDTPAPPYPSGMIFDVPLTFGGTSYVINLNSASFTNLSIVVNFTNLDVLEDNNFLLYFKYRGVDGVNNPELLFTLNGNTPEGLFGYSPGIISSQGLALNIIVSATSVDILTAFVTPIP